MNKRELEMKLQDVEGFSENRAELEQYQTPPSLATQLLWHAYMSGDLKDKKVYDLGCGTGVLAIGAKLLGARKVTGVDVDERALEKADDNAERSGVDIEFGCMEVSEVEGEADLVVQNPPFGSQEKGGDRPFIKKALETAPVVYSFHKKETEGFVEGFVSECGEKVADKVSVDFPLPRSMPWHEEEVETVKVNLYRFERK